jgi:hypothetical protein
MLAEIPKGEGDPEASLYELEKPLRVVIGEMCEDKPYTLRYKRSPYPELGSDFVARPKRLVQERDGQVFLTYSVQYNPEDRIYPIHEDIPFTLDGLLMRDDRTEEAGYFLERDWDDAAAQLAPPVEEYDPALVL